MGGFPYKPPNYQKRKEESTMTKILLKIVAQRATKYNKIQRAARRAREEDFSRPLQAAQAALDRALAAVQHLGYIGIIWLANNTIDKIIVGDHVLEIR